jgi:hypothetical protein
MLNKLYIGRNGDKSLIFSGNILNLINIKLNEGRVNYVELPSKVTVEGVIEKCDIAELKSQVTNELSKSLYWKSSDIESIDTNYILKMDDHPRIVKTKSASSIDISKVIVRIIGLLLVCLISAGVRNSKR